MVSKGKFNVNLGDTSIDHMAALDPNIMQRQLYLRTWFDDGKNGSEKLNPDYRLTSAPYAVASNTANTVVNSARFKLVDIPTGIYSFQQKSYQHPPLSFSLTAPSDGYFLFSFKVNHYCPDVFEPHVPEIKIEESNSVMPPLIKDIDQPDHFIPVKKGDYNFKLYFGCHMPRSTLHNSEVNIGNSAMLVNFYPTKM